MKYQKEAHKVYSLRYHVIFVVKYRQQVFLEGHDIINDVKEKIIELSRNFDVELLEIECGIDHVHLLIGAKPTLDIPKWINSVKGNTSRFLREKHSDFLRDKGGSFLESELFHRYDGERVPRRVEAIYRRPKREARS